jgi:hypothetical protein
MGELPMTCIHLRKLYQLCQDEGLKLGGSDLIRIVCEQCGVQDVCPAVLVDEYDARHAEPESDEPGAEKRVAQN